MTDFELIMLFNETFDFLISSFTTYLSIVFAFLVASLVLGKRLNRLLASIAVSLFSVASLLFCLLCFAVSRNLGELAEVIKNAVRAGQSELSWVGFVAQDAPIGRGTAVIAVLMFLSYVACILFFFYQRRSAQMDI